MPLINHHVGHGLLAHSLNRLFINLTVFRRCLRDNNSREGIIMSLEEGGLAETQAISGGLQ